MTLFNGKVPKLTKKYRPDIITFTWKRGSLTINQQFLEEMPIAKQKRLMALIHKAMGEN